MKIKRPLFVIALSMLVVICAINTVPESILYCSLALFIIFIVIHRLTANRYTWHMILFLLAALAATGYFAMFRNNLSVKIQDIAKKDNVTVTGIVTLSDKTDWSNCYHIKIDSVDGKKIRNLSAVMYSDEFIEKGDRVTVDGKLNNFTPKSDYLYNYSQGIFASLSCEKLIKHDEISTFTGVFADIQTKLVNKSRKIFDYRYSPVAIAMGLGDKSFISENINNKFKIAGISHALVVSGLHIGFVASAITAMLYYIPIKKKLKNIITLTFVGIFMAVIGFTPSIIRAGALVIAVLTGRTFLTETDNYTVLAMIIIITLIINPYSANNGSLLLSYSAYFGVIYAADLCNTKGVNKILTVLMLPAFAVLYTCPALAVLDMGTTYLAPVFNFILSPVIMVVCVLSFFLPVISYIPFIGVIVPVFAPVNNILIMFLIKFTEFAEKYFSFAYIEFTDEAIKVVIFAVVIAVLMSLILLNDNKNRIISSVAISIGIVLCYNYLNSNTAVIRIFDGSSEPSYIVTYKDKNYLIATENINDKRLTDVTQQLGIDRYNEIICCMKTEADTEIYSMFSDEITIISESGVYKSDIITIDTRVNNRRMSYIMHIGELDIGFSHNKADLSEKEIDLYFFGSDVPGDFNAMECYYFYPENKKQAEIIEEKHAAELYDVLTIKAKLPDGSYHIVKDVKNFGNQLQNNR